MVRLRILPVAVLAAMGLFLYSSCSGESEKAQETAADIEAAQMMGRNAAKRFVGRPWKDTLELQRQLLEARAEHSKYVRANKPQSARAYDSTFVSTMKTVRPDLALHLK